MSAAAVAAGAMAVESQNIVGVVTTDSVDGNNFITLPLNNIGYNTADIQQIKLSDGGAQGIGWGEEDFSVWEGLPSVVAGSGFFYYDPSMDPNAEETDYYWGNNVGEKASYTILPGQGVVISSGADLDIFVSGQVPAASQVSFTSVEGNNFTGNPFPEAIDIQAIAISDGGAQGIGWGEEDFSIWEGLPIVVAGSGFFYYDPSMDPNAEETDYYWGNNVGVKATYAIEPGQGVVISCGADLDVTIDPPYNSL